MTLERTDIAQIPRKYLEARSVEEIAELLKEDGKDEAKAERTWEEICHSREQLGSDLSLDEL